MSSLEPAVRALAAEAWHLRWRVEREAGLRFDRFARGLEALGAPEPLISLAQRATGDEARHAELCASLATHLGATLEVGPPPALPEIAPAMLDGRGRLLYELVAACCITETESVGTLTTLLAAEPLPEVRAVLQAIARDEVDHARLGWGALAFARAHGGIDFLAPLVPVMLAGTVSDALFRPAGHEAQESPELLRLGVLPHSQKRQTFVAMLREVVLPGLAEVGVDPEPARAWLDARAPGEAR